MTTPTTAPVAPAPPPASHRPGGSARLPLQILGVALSVLLVAWGAVTLAGLLSRVTENRSGAFSGVGTVDLDLDFESVEVVGSSSVTDVSMERSYTWSMAKPSIGARQVGDRLLLTSSCPFNPGRSCSGRLRLLVPAGLRVQGDTGDGHLTLRDLTGPVTVSTSDGGVEASGLTGAVTVTTRDGGIDVSGVRGRLAVTTRDGSVNATALRSADVTAKSGDGGVRLAFAVPPTSVRAESGDGSVDITVPKDGSPYDVVADTGDGSRQVSVPTDPSSSRRIEVRTRDGGIRIANVP